MIVVINKIPLMRKSLSLFQKLLFVPLQRLDVTPQLHFICGRLFDTLELHVYASKPKRIDYSYPYSQVINTYRNVVL